MSDSIKTSERLTRERFHELLLAYMGAMHHAQYASAQYGSSSPEYRAATNAATQALRTLEQAVGV